MIFVDGTVIPIFYDGVLPYIPVRRPTQLEIDDCKRVQFTLRDYWKPYHYKNRLSALTGKPHSKISITYTDLISLGLMSCKPKERSSSHQLLYSIRQGERITSNLSFRTLGAFRSRQTYSLIPESLSMMWQISLKTAKNNTQATTQKCIRSIGLLAKRFKTDKSQLRYKQLSRHYGTLYVDFLKTTLKSFSGFIGSMLYCNKLGLKKFLPCTSETLEETSHSLRSDDYNNLREGYSRKH